LTVKRLGEVARAPFEQRNYAVVRSLLRVDPAHLWSDYRLAKAARALGALQKWRELAPLIGLLRTRRLETVVEIGTARGGTLWLWCRLADQKAVIVSIDLAAAPGLRRYRAPRQTLRFLASDSHSAATREALVEILAGRPIDLLMIDGDHTYEGVRRDFELYSPLVAEGGLIAFHDIVRPSHQRSCRVDVFWNEIKGDYRHVEIRERPGDRAWEEWGGIGVLFQAVNPGALGPGRVARVARCDDESGGQHTAGYNGAI
jgi:predicted O-methyltransferase YrrM